MKVETNERGFRSVMHVKSGTPATVARLLTESSIVGDYYDALQHPGSSALWIGDDFHLGREEVLELVWILQSWITKKRLPDPGPQGTLCFVDVEINKEIAAIGARDASACAEAQAYPVDHSAMLAIVHLRDQLAQASARIKAMEADAVSAANFLLGQLKALQHAMGRIRTLEAECARLKTTDCVGSDYIRGEAKLLRELLTGTDRETHAIDHICSAHEAAKKLKARAATLEETLRDSSEVLTLYAAARGEPVEEGGVGDTHQSRDAHSLGAFEQIKRIRTVLDASTPHDPEAPR